MATSLPAVNPALRTRLEGAVEDVEFALQARDEGRLAELAERWTASCEAVEAVRRHHELEPLGFAPAGAARPRAGWLDQRTM